MGVRGSFPLMNCHAWPAPSGLAYIAVGMQRALDSAIGLPRRSTRASRMLVFLMPAEVRRSLMVPFLGYLADLLDEPISRPELTQCPHARGCPRLRECGEQVLDSVVAPLLAICRMHTIRRGPGHRVALRLVLEGKAGRDRRDAILLAQLQRLDGGGVGASLEYPGLHRPHRPLDHEVGAAEGARGDVVVHDEALEVVLPAHTKVDLTDLEWFGREPHAHVLRLRQHVEDELGGCVELPGDQHFAVARKLDGGRAMSRGLHRTRSFRCRSLR